MPEVSEQDITQIGIRLLGDAQTAWRAAEAETAAALGAWCDGTIRDHQAAWSIYVAALDREEAAARDLQRLTSVTGSIDGRQRGLPSSICTTPIRPSSKPASQ
jgi:hypothetical protein